ncbi:MAG: 50S ribosomal protein L21 [Thermodesulfobacteriota bacterium]|jgi:large subunit ribosomal protein L21|nr:MAG: 50S ribosomal protein L21 [Thermodesulfobacteriota bacterium]
MFAVVRTGGKQYKVKEGDIIKIEKLVGEEGELVELEEILLIGDAPETTIGQPLVPNAKVACSIISQGKSKKVVIFKAKRRKGYQKKQGHRQSYTSVKINQIIV